jgi:hypothetical protein
MFIDSMFYFYRAVVWAREVGISCTTDSARMLHNQYLCTDISLKGDFTTAERRHLNRVAYPHGSDSASCSSPQQSPYRSVDKGQFGDK